MLHAIPAPVYVAGAMTQNYVSLTDSQKREVVDRAIALMRDDGATQNAACKQAAQEYGISAPSVRRYATRQGRPLSAVTDEAAQKMADRAVTLHKVYGASKQREIAMVLVEAIETRAATLREQAAKGEGAPPDIDLRLQRATVALREATELEHALFLRGAAPAPGEDRTEDEEREPRPENVSDLDESRRLMAEMEAARG